VWPEGTKAETRHVWWPNGKCKRAARISMRDEEEGEKERLAIGETVAGEAWVEVRSTAATVRGGKGEWGGVWGGGLKHRRGRVAWAEQGQRGEQGQQATNLEQSAVAALGRRRSILPAVGAPLPLRPTAGR
jgi:hypothetical protein